MKTKLVKGTLWLVVTITSGYAVWWLMTQPTVVSSSREEINLGPLALSLPNRGFAVPWATDMHVVGDGSVAFTATRPFVVYADGKRIESVPYDDQQAIVVAVFDYATTLQLNVGDHVRGRLVSTEGELKAAWGWANERFAALVTAAMVCGAMLIILILDVFQVSLITTEHWKDGSITRSKMMFTPKRLAAFAVIMALGGAMFYLLEAGFLWGWDETQPVSAAEKPLEFPLDTTALVVTGDTVSIKAWAAVPFAFQKPDLVIQAEEKPRPYPWGQPRYFELTATLPPGSYRITGTLPAMVGSAVGKAEVTPRGNFMLNGWLSFFLWLMGMAIAGIIGVGIFSIESEKEIVRPTTKPSTH